MSAVTAARRLIEQGPGHHVISLYLDLDPERFATPPARATQIRSLLDAARRTVEGQDGLSHEELVALRGDVERLEEYLLSREPPFQGARGLAVFVSGPDGQFEVVPLHHPVEGRVVVDRRPFVEPLLAGASGASGRTWCVVLVSRREARVFSGSADSPRRRKQIDDDVHGQHRQGGWSQARYERSVEQDADDHLRAVAEEVRKLCERSHVDAVALGGPHEVVARFQDLLSAGVRARLVEDEVELDVATASENTVREALAGVVEKAERAQERAALDVMAEGIGRGGRAVGGLEDTLAALTERRVARLLLEPLAATSAGGRCPRCGLLSGEPSGECPADGTALEGVDPLREAMVEAALIQDAEIVSVERFPDLGPFGGVGALLRF